LCASIVFQVVQDNFDCLKRAGFGISFENGEISNVASKYNNVPSECALRNCPNQRDAMADVGNNLPDYCRISGCTLPCVYAMIEKDCGKTAAQFATKELVGAQVSFLSQGKLPEQCQTLSDNWINSVGEKPKLINGSEKPKLNNNGAHSPILVKNQFVFFVMLPALVLSKLFF